MALDRSHPARPELQFSVCVLSSGMMAFAIAPISRTPFYVKKRLNGRLRPLTNPANFRRDLFDDGCEDGCPCCGAWGGLSAGLRTHKREAEALLRRSLSQHCAAIVSGREAAKFL